MFLSFGSFSFWFLCIITVFMVIIVIIIKIMSNYKQSKLTQVEGIDIRALVGLVEDNESVLSLRHFEFEMLAKGANEMKKSFVREISTEIWESRESFYKRSRYSATSRSRERMAVSNITVTHDQRLIEDFDKSV